MLCLIYIYIQFVDIVNTLPSTTCPKRMRDQATAAKAKSSSSKPCIFDFDLQAEMESVDRMLREQAASSCLFASYIANIEFKQCFKHVLHDHCIRTV